MADLKQIADELGIDVPILAVKQKGDSVEVHLYGGEVKVWTPGKAKKELDQMTVKELRELVKEKGVKGYSTMSKKELLFILKP